MDRVGIAYAIGTALAALAFGVALGVWLFALGGADHTIDVSPWLLIASALLGGLCAALAGLWALSFVRRRPVGG